MSGDKKAFLKRFKQASDAGELMQAVALCHGYLEQYGDDVDVWYRMGVVKGVQEDFAGAAACFIRLLSVSPDHVEGRTQLAKAYRLLGDHEASIEQLGYLVNVVAEPEIIYREIAYHQRILGQFELAEAALRKAIKLDPDSAVAYETLSSIKHYSSADDPDLVAMKRLLSRARLPNDQLVYLHFAMAKIYEDIHDDKNAFNSLAAGNRIYRSSCQYDVAQDEQLLDQIGEIFTRDYIATYADAGNASRMPVFIVGMPRSGSTLIEQILSCHHSVGSAGEIDAFVKCAIGGVSGKNIEVFRTLEGSYFQNASSHYLDEIKKYSQGLPYVTDKALDNYRWIGLIRIMFPNAKVIHCVRNPMDNCLAMYKKRFNATHRYTYDLIELGRVYIAYKKLMDYWHQILPGFIYDIQYEDMVTNQEEQTRALLDYCELDWDESCLKFYESDRGVKTASQVQVRQKMYSTSLSKWRRFEQQLSPLSQLFESYPGIVVR